MTHNSLGLPSYITLHRVCWFKLVNWLKIQGPLLVYMTWHYNARLLKRVTSHLRGLTQFCCWQQWEEDLPGDLHTPMLWQNNSDNPMEGMTFMTCTPMLCQKWKSTMGKTKPQRYDQPQRRSSFYHQELYTADTETKQICQRYLYPKWLEFQQGERLRCP